MKNEKRTLSERNQDYMQGRKDGLEEAIKVLNSEAQIMYKVLTNGREICKRAKGERLKLMHEKRWALWTKVNKLNRIIETLLKRSLSL